MKQYTPNTCFLRGAREEFQGDRSRRKTRPPPYKPEGTERTSRGGGKQVKGHDNRSIEGGATRRYRGAREKKGGCFLKGEKRKKTGLFKGRKGSGKSINQIGQPTTHRFYWKNNNWPPGRKKSPGSTKPPKKRKKFHQKGEKLKTHITRGTPEEEGFNWGDVAFPTHKKTQFQTGPPPEMAAGGGRVKEENEGHFKKKRGKRERKKRATKLGLYR